MKKGYIKKWLIILLIFSIILPHQFIGNSYSVLAAQTGTVIASTLNVRSKASTTASKVQLSGVDVFLSKGETVNVLNTEGEFYHVSLKFNGKTVEGYVHKDFVQLAKGSVTVTPTPKPTVTPKPTATPKATTTPAPTKAPSTETQTSTSITKKVQIKATITASTLNIRSGPGTSYSSVASLVKGNSVTVINETLSKDKKEWYGISFVSNGKTLTGYVDSSYLKLTYGSGIKAQVAASTLNIKAKAGSKASNLKYSNGNIVRLAKNKEVTIVDETTISGEKWFKLSFVTYSVKRTGYAPASQIDFKSTVKATPTPTTKPSPTPTKAPSTETQTSTTTKKVQIKATVTASTLNVRSGAGTSYTSVGSLVKGSTVTVINETLTADKKEWYGISFVSNGKTMTGYVDSTYLKLTYGSGIKAQVSVSDLNIRAAAGSKASYLKYTNGSIVRLGKNKEVTLLDETTVSGEKWFKLSFVTYSVKRTGYALASQIDFQTTEKATPTPTPKPTATPTPTSKPTTTQTPTSNPTIAPTKAPTSTPKVTATPTTKPTDQPAIIPSKTIINQGGLETRNVIEYNNILGPVRGLACNSTYINVYSSITNGLVSLVGSNSQSVQLQSGQEVIVTEANTISGSVYYKIYFWYNNVINTGYVQAAYIYISNITPEVTPSPIPTPTSVVTPTPTPASNQSYTEQLRSLGFPESYIPSLVELHNQYPKWEFRPYQTGLDWNATIAAESVPGKNLIPNSRSVEWKSLASGAYDWKTDAFTVYDGTTWVTASQEAIKYYMDPRNFLTVNGIFQFELLKYQSGYQNVAGVENILKGTALYNSYYTFIDDAGVTQTYSYGETFLKAAEYSGVSPYHLASRVKQEVVTGSTTLSGSVTGKYSGYEGYYNFYNIGAADSAGGGAVANGLKYAKNGSTSAATNALYMIPWTNPYKSIVGGSSFIGGSYINRGQDTIYLQKFNVTPTSTYYHQYMSNVEAPYAEAKKVLTAYNGMSDSPIIFSIPVYLNMPATASPLPTTAFNPNNRMKSLQVLDAAGKSLALTPTFSQTELNYYIMVANDVSSVQIKASAVSKKATIKDGSSTVALEVGTNVITIPVIAENGEIANYNVTIVRAQ